MHPGPGYQDNGDRFFLEVGRGREGLEDKRARKRNIIIIDKKIKKTLDNSVVIMVVRGYMVGLCCCRAFRGCPGVNIFTEVQHGFDGFEL